MDKREIVFWWACFFILSMFVACDNGFDLLSSNDKEVGNNGDTGVRNNGAYTETVAEALTANSGDHENSGDYTWESSNVNQIVLNGNKISINAVGATVDSSKVTITSAGTYSISGSLADGQIIVDTEEDEPNAAIFSKDNLTIYGDGSLTVDGNYNDGIASKDGLIIASGTITVSAVDDGIRGKDYLVVKDGNITVNAKGNGLKSDNDEDDTKGYILIKDGVINIISGGDAIEAETDVLITDGEIILSSGVGRIRSYYGNTSAKGIKAVVSLIIDGGTIAISSADNAIHSNGSLAINGGSLVISSGDDGIHADSTLGVNGGDIRITKSYEGIESRSVISINGGGIHIISSDDGLNVAGGRDGSGFHGGPGDFSSAGDYYLYINGGYIVINATGDGIDSNGSIVMTDGDVIIHGPTSNMNGALDHASFKITGGLLVAAGSSGIAQVPGTSSTQYSVLLNFRSSLQAGTLFHIQTSDGNEILSFTPTKRYQSIAFSSSEIKKGSTYDVYYGGSSNGTVNDGLYGDGTYTPGTKYTNFTISSIVTSVRNR